MTTVKKIKKAQGGGTYRGGCVATTAAADRADRREGRQAERDYNKLMRQNKRDERKAERAERKASPPAKHGKSVVKKAQDGKALRDTTNDAKNRKQSPALTEMGKKTTRAAINKRTDEMAKSLDRASVFGKNYIAPGDSAKKKAVNKPVPKKKMMNGGKAKKMMSGGKCKYGC